MNNWRYRLFQFMQGRYGMDEFGRFLLIVTVIVILLSNFHYLISDLYISPFRSTLRRIYFTIHYHANNPIIACFTTIIVVSLKDVIHHTTRVNRPVHPGTQIRSRRCNDRFTRVER